jgi:hypothetical protein
VLNRRTPCTGSCQIPSLSPSSRSTLRLSIPLAKVTWPELRARRIHTSRLAPLRQRLPPVVAPVNADAPQQSSTGKNPRFELHHLCFEPQFRSEPSPAISSDPAPASSISSLLPTSLSRIVSRRPRALSCLPLGFLRRRRYLDGLPPGPPSRPPGRLPSRHRFPCPSRLSSPPSGRSTIRPHPPSTVIHLPSRSRRPAAPSTSTSDRAPPPPHRANPTPAPSTPATTLARHGQLDIQLDLARGSEVGLLSHYALQLLCDFCSEMHRCNFCNAILEKKNLQCLLMQKVQKKKLQFLELDAKSC